LVRLLARVGSWARLPRQNPTPEGRMETARRFADDRGGHAPRTRQGRPAPGPSV